MKIPITELLLPMTDAGVGRASIQLSRSPKGVRVGILVSKQNADAKSPVTASEEYVFEGTANVVLKSVQELLANSIIV